MAEAEQLLVFQGQNRIAQGAAEEVRSQLVLQAIQEGALPYQVFRARDGQQVDIDLQGTPTPQASAIPRKLSAAPASAQKPRGRPKLGVVGREVTLLPRHWEWLDRQRGGASAALRRIIDADRRQHADEDRVRQAQDATHRFMFSMAGNLAGFEEAMRALYAGDKSGFAHHIRNWPADIRGSTVDFARDAFGGD